MTHNIQLPYIKPGRYVVAVSGGVDSMVLMELLRTQPDLELVIAHFDHGIRKDSVQDRKLVQRIAMSHNLSFEYANGRLGAKASEATAREARYNFLRHICKKYNATAIITAHHQDDLLETAIINLIRGTGRRGLNALDSHDSLLRPLLQTSKVVIVAYAAKHRLAWRDDPTNNDQMYLRNYVRHSILPRFNAEKKTQLLQIIVRQNNINHAIDDQLHEWFNVYAPITSDSPPPLPRYQLIMTPPLVAYEILQQLCKVATGNTLEKSLANKALLFAKTAQSGKQFTLNNTWRLRATKHQVIVEPRDP